MHPLNDVVAHVHRIDIRWHDFDAKRVAITGSFESLVPPTRAFGQSRTHRLRRAAIDVINDRLNGIADWRRRIFLLQTMTADEVFPDWLADRRGKVHVLNAEETGAGIVFAWRISGRR